MQDFIVSTEYDGKPRRLYPTVCEVCKQTFYAPKHRSRKHCSQACFGISQRNRVALDCRQCGKPFHRAVNKLEGSVHQVFFCSRKCKDEAQGVDGKCPEIRPEHYGAGTWKYRSRALKKYGAVCNCCGYSEIEAMLDVHHKDEDRGNPDIENLEVLCVWCHALKTRGVVAQSGERVFCKHEAVGS